MAFDGLVMAAVARELEEQLVGSRIEKIHQPGPREIVLVIHARGMGKKRLLISADSRDARIHFTEAPYINPMAPPIFCMVLRKHLEGSKIRSVQQMGLERVLKIAVDSRDELGRPSEKVLYCEVMGKHSNIVLVDPEGNNIVDGVNRYSRSVSRYREVLPNRPYLVPPDQEKTDPRNLTEDTFRAAILGCDLSGTVAGALLQLLAGVGPKTCRELVFRAGLKADYALEFCGDYELRQLWEQVDYLRKILEQGLFEPTLLLDRRGLPLDYGAINLSHIQAYRRDSGSMSKVLDHYYTSLAYKRLLESSRQSLLQTVRREIDRLQKKARLYEESLSSAEQADIYRIYGELLTANLYQLEQGSSAIVENFYDPDCAQLVIPMEQHLSPNDNAQAYFKKYLKSKNTREAVLVRQEQAQEELAYLEAVETALLQASDHRDLEEIRSELEDQLYLKVKPQVGSKKSKKELQNPQPLIFTSSEGYTILVGKNNRQNDYLTLRLAKDEDIWLHTKDIPGSHVIIRNNQKIEVPEQTLKEAASLAAWFSKARQSGKVPVDYTPRHNVRKPRGGKPGMVIYDSQRTIWVAPDEALVEKLTPGD